MNTEKKNEQSETTVEGFEEYTNIVIDYMQYLKSNSEVNSIAIPKRFLNKDY